MFKKAVTAFLSISFIIILSSCGKHQQILKSSDNEFKYQMAVQYFEKEDYYRAEQLFDQLLPIYRGTAKSEMINYYYAYCYYNQQDFIMASYYFKRFAKYYPKSEYAEECAFKAAYCKFLDSPEYSLDQSTTYAAINELQLFANLYPQSELVAECNDLIDQMRAKLEEKAYKIARLYFRMDEYKSAIFSYKSVLEDFPSTKYKEIIMFDMVKANFEYAENSVSSKRKERYLNAVKAYDKFASMYPESKYFREATNIRNSIIENNL